MRQLKRSYKLNYSFSKSNEKIFDLCCDRISIPNSKYLLQENLVIFGTILLEPPHFIRYVIILLILCNNITFL